MVLNSSTSISSLKKSSDHEWFTFSRDPWEELMQELSVQGFMTPIWLFHYLDDGFLIYQELVPLPLTG